MNWLRFVIVLTFAGQLASSQGSAEREEAPPAGPTISPVLRPLEPAESRVILLPGSNTQRPRVSKPAVPSRPLAAPSAARVAPAFVLPPMPVAPVPPPELAEAPAPSLTSVPLLPPPTLPTATLPTAMGPPGLPAAPEPPAPTIAVTAAAKPFTRPALPEPPAAPPVVAEPATLIPPTVVAVPDPSAPPPTPPSPAFEPREFQAQSALFLQSRIGQWNLADTRLILGEPARQRPALDDKQVANGTIFAFADPTGRYKELELDFDSESRLRTVFAYPQDVTWQELRQLFGANVTATKGNKGRMFYSYLNRHLDVLVGPDGQVVSLGLY